MAKPYSKVLSKDQYLNSFVDFYNQTLGTGISSSVAIDPTEDQDQQQSAGPNIFTDSDDNPSNFLTPTITMETPEQVMSRATKEIAEDRNDSFFKDYNVREQIQEFYKSDAGKFVGGISAITGSFIPAALVAGGIAVSDLNRRVRDRAAYDVYAAGNLAGSTLTVGGQPIVRKPGSTTYTGTVTGDPKQIYAQEQIMYGYIPGTMKESEGGEEQGGNWSRTGFEGLLSAKSVAKLDLKGNYDAYGNFHSANGASSMGTMEAGRALYNEIVYGGAAGRTPTNAEVASFMKDFRTNFAAEKKWYTNVWNIKPEDYANARKTTIQKLRDKYGIDSTKTESPSTTPTTPTTSAPDSGTTPDYSTPGSTVSESTDDSGGTTYIYSGQDSQGNTVTTSSTYDEAGMNITAPSSTTTARTAQDDIVGPTPRPAARISITSSDSNDDNFSGGGTKFSGTTTSYGTKVSSNVGGAGEHADIGNYVTEKQKQEKSGGDGGGKDDSCVIATHGISTGGFTLMEKAKAELWCQKTYHDKWYGEAFRRGYRAAGQRCIDSGNAEQHYQEFKDFVSYGRGVKKSYKLAINYYLRTLQFFITGMFLGK